MHQDPQNLANKRPGENLEPDSIKRIQTLDFPIGDAEIKSVIRSGYYADKTMFAGKLLIEGKSKFLIRPRRFGKSLFIDTIATIAEGEVNKELFKNYFICNGEFENKKGISNEKEKSLYGLIEYHPEE